MFKKTPYSGCFTGLLIICLALQASAQSKREPGANRYGTLGMSQVVSAEPMGDGRLTVKLTSDFYRQYKTVPGLLNNGAQINTTTGSLAYGLNAFTDVFLSASQYSLTQAPKHNGPGYGTTVMGLQGSVPLAENFPLRLGVQVATLFGTTHKAIDTNGLDGYNYLETRDYTDVMFRLTQSLLLSPWDMGLKFHLNEGTLSSFKPGKQVGLLAGAGVEFSPWTPLILGMEINWRTFRKHPSDTDPLWITPSLVYWTPVHLNLQGGVDIALSKDRSPTLRPLEPWKIFGAFTFSLNIFSEKNRADALEKSIMMERAERTQAAEEQLARQKKLSDSLVLQNTKDSLDLADLRRQIEEERSKRSDAEKQLLSTGLLLLDAVYFETGKTAISINSDPYLNIIAKTLLKYPKLQIEVAGHTDNVGGSDYNMKLSQGRAESVRNYMLMVAPELRNILTAKGYGFTQPKADNQTPYGRMHNRRTELRVLNREALAGYNP